MRSFLISLLFCFSISLHALKGSEISDDSQILELGANWLTDFEVAKERSIKENKPIMLYFTGSNWCGYCVVLEKKVFSKKAFIDYSNEELILMYLDFPRGKRLSTELEKQNYTLLDKYGSTIPDISFINSQGKLLGNTGYIPTYVKQGAEAYVEHLKSILEE